MKYFYEPENLNTTEDLVREFRALTAKACEFLRQIPPDRFFAHPDKGWSIAENVKHLSKTTWPITMGLKLPSAVPSALFGKGKGSRPFAEIKRVYYASLAEGFQAGIYTPGKAVAGQAEQQEKLIRKFEASVNDLIDAFSRLDDVLLDTVRMPHPAIGRLTLREMLYSSLNHDIHHMSVVAARS